MNRFSKTLLGVTLLEIMLVLAVAAMIIVMSVRYYQSASSNQQANALLQQLQAIAGIADGIAQASNSYSKVSTSTVKAMMPNPNMMTTPWGEAISVNGGSSSTYSVTVNNNPPGVCQQVASRLSSNPRFGTPSCSGGNLTYTYDAKL